MSRSLAVPNTLRYAYGTLSSQKCPLYMHSLISVLCISSLLYVVAFTIESEK